jgi:hypothetical protein
MTSTWGKKRNLDLKPHLSQKLTQNGDLNIKLLRENLERFSWLGFGRVLRHDNKSTIHERKKSCALPKLKT